MTERVAKAAPEVDAYDHAEAKRRNIPTAENQALVPDDQRKQSTLRYPRNADLDPQLVWRGKDEENNGDLEVQAPPIYIQEKIKPEALIANLKKRGAGQRAQTQDIQASFFSDFNGLPEGWQSDAASSYYHDEGHWSNRMILGDSLLVMASLSEREKLAEQVQTIYIDPPYGITFNSNWQPSTKSRTVIDGKQEAVSREPEVIKAFRDTWSQGIHSYLSYLRDRLLASHRLLKPTGSVFVQIGDENVHRVRAILDEVFGEQNYVSEILVKKKGSQVSSALDPVNDYILWYAKDIDKAKIRKLFVVGEDENLFDDYPHVELGQQETISIAELEKRDGVLYRRDYRAFRKAYPDARLFALNPLKSGGFRANQSHPFVFQGRTFPIKEGSCWKHTIIDPNGSTPGMERLARADRLVPLRTDVRFKRYAPNPPIKTISNWWDGFGGAPNQVYVVQTNERVLERIILLSTDPGDIVLDPTCGSGTTAFVAEQWGRRWITIDTSRVALALARTRLMSANYDWYALRNEGAGPSRNGDVGAGFQYQDVKQVTSGSIANNIEIDVIWQKYRERLDPIRERINAALGTEWQEWDIPRTGDSAWSDAVRADHESWWAGRLERQSEMDQSIARGAEVELLLDRPKKERGIVRVSGPFTVESLSPHRMLPLDEEEVPANDAEADGVGVAPNQTDFGQVVFDNLKAAGVQNSKKGEAIKFEWLKPFASRKGYVAFEGRYLESGIEKRAAIALGPEYDTVGYEFVRRAAREAADLFDTLIVCGFAFAPEVDESRLNFGGLTVLKARMNQDLRMADKLKATGAGNLFVVFGEPDIEIEDADDGMVRVRIKGVDIFDPTSGDVKSSDDPAEDIACWFIDDDYDDDSFFVRQAYFLGRDPYDSLKRALKAEVDEDAWSELNSTVSRPFARPANGQICVKVINHFGDEVQKVFSV